MIYCYILKLMGGTHYCGITNDLGKRLQEHQQGKSKHTKKYLPVYLMWYVSFKDRKSARAWEVMVKNEGVSRWLHKNIGIGTAPVYPPTQHTTTTID